MVVVVAIVRRLSEEDGRVAVRKESQQAAKSRGLSMSEGGLARIARITRRDKRRRCGFGVDWWREDNLYACMHGFIGNGRVHMLYCVYY